MKKNKDFIEDNMGYIIGYSIATIITIGCCALGLVIANWIGNSDLPDWLKLYLLTL